MTLEGANHSTCPNGMVWCVWFRSKNHCAELSEQNKSITQFHKVTTMTASKEMLLVLLQASYVSSHGDVKLGTLWDLCSTADYITFKKADELALEGREVVLTIKRDGVVENTITTKLYDVPVCMERKKKGQSKFTLFQCYGRRNLRRIQSGTLCMISSSTLCWTRVFQGA